MAFEGSAVSTEVLLEAGFCKADSWLLSRSDALFGNGDSPSTTVSPTFCLGCATEIFTEPLRIAGANHIISTVDLAVSTMVNQHILKWNR